MAGSKRSHQLERGRHKLEEFRKSRSKKAEGRAAKAGAKADGSTVPTEMEGGPSPAQSPLVESSSKRLRPSAQSPLVETVSQSTYAEAANGLPKESSTNVGASLPTDSHRPSWLPAPPPPPPSSASSTAEPPVRSNGQSSQRPPQSIIDRPVGDGGIEAYKNEYTGFSSLPTSTYVPATSLFPTRPAVEDSAPHTEPFPRQKQGSSPPMKALEEMDVSEPSDLQDEKRLSDTPSAREDAPHLAGNTSKLDEAFKKPATVSESSYPDPIQAVLDATLAPTPQLGDSMENELPRVTPFMSSIVSERSALVDKARGQGYLPPVPQAVAKSSANGQDRALQGSGKLKSRDSSLALEELIDELTQEKFMLQRGMESHRQLAETLATENAALSEDYNAQGSVLEGLRQDLARMQSEFEAQSLVVASMAVERDHSRNSYQESNSRAQSLANEVVALEEKNLRQKANEVSLQHKLRNAEEEIEITNRRLNSLTLERSGLHDEVHRLKEDVRRLTSKLRKANLELPEPAGSDRAGPQKRRGATSYLRDLIAPQPHTGPKFDKLAGVVDEERSTPSEQVEVAGEAAADGEASHSSRAHTPPTNTEQDARREVESTKTAVAEPGEEIDEDHALRAGPMDGRDSLVPVDPRSMVASTSVTELALASIDVERIAHRMKLARHAGSDRTSAEGGLAALPEEHISMVHNIDVLLEQVAMDRVEALAQAAAEMEKFKALQAENEGLKEKLSRQAAQLELAVSRSLVTVPSRENQREDDDEEVVDRALTFLVRLFGGGSGKRRRKSVLN